MRQLLIALWVVGLAAALPASAERRPGADWKRPGIPDGSALSAVLDAAHTPLDAGEPLPGRTLVYVRPEKVVWDDGEPYTQVVVQDARIERDPEIEIEKGRVSIAAIILLGLPIRETTAVATGALEVEGKLVFLETRHELAIEGALPTGGVVGLWIEPASNGRYRRLVAVRGPGPDRIQGVAPQVLPYAMQLENVTPVIHTLELPPTPELTRRRWQAVAARVEKRGATGQAVSRAVAFLDGLWAEPTDDQSLFALAEGGLREQLALRDSPADRLSLMRLLAQTDRATEARAHLEPLASELPYQPEVAVELAMIAAETGDVPLARRLLAPALDDPEQPIVARAVCARLQQQAPDEVGCPEPSYTSGTTRTPTVDFEDLLAQGEDTPSFGRESHVVMDKQLRGAVLESVRVERVEKTGANLSVRFEVRLLEDHAGARVFLVFNPPGAGWLEGPMKTGDDPLSRYFVYQHTRPDDRGFVWYLKALDRDERELLGSRADPFDLTPRP